MVDARSGLKHNLPPYTYVPSSEATNTFQAARNIYHGSSVFALQSVADNTESTTSSKVWLAAVKLEWENNAFARARILLKKACDRAPTAKVWMKAALLERELKEPEAALKLIDTALPSYPTFAKLYMMAGQVCVRVCRTYLAVLGAAAAFVLLVVL